MWFSQSYCPVLAKTKVGIFFMLSKRNAHMNIWWCGHYQLFILLVTCFVSVCIWTLSNFLICASFSVCIDFWVHLDICISCFTTINRAAMAAQQYLEYLSQLLDYPFLESRFFILPYTPMSMQHIWPLDIWFVLYQD